MNAEQSAALRAPFPKEQIGKLPKGGTSLDYVGHAAVTDRLLSVDPAWVWTPDRTPDGRWDIQRVGKEAVLTGTLTVCDVTRPCVGTAPENAFELAKQLQSDAIRNGAMRFGVALDLWAKEDLSGSSAPVSVPSQPDPTRAAKARVLEAAGGDKAIAAEAWKAGGDDDARMTIAADLLAAKQAPFEGDR